ncbi:MAG: mechanosensitive ion channel family protein [Thermoprotei archaeon]|nr:MAG: mechanosensitive ion channel family protein [Thermoprotei archaeon]
MDIASAFTSPLPFVGFSIYQLMLFIVWLIIGIIIVRVIVNIVRRALEKAKTPPLVAGLLVSIIKTIGYIVVVLSVLPIIGIDTSTVGLGLSAIIGLILGFGLQDTWANMAAGVWLAVIRPFDKGDYVEVAGHSGVVDGIGVMSTTLKTWDNVVITIPNKNIWGAPIVNYSREPIRRITLDIGVAYGTDLDKAINVAMEVIKNNPKVLSEPQPAVVVTELGDSSINLQLRAWVKKEDFGSTKAELIMTIYKEFGKAGIEIPFPQLDVHIRDMPK